MSTHQHSVEVERPLRTVYDQWTQFESFPQFMEGVESITQIDETHSHWVTTTGGATREFDTVITEQIPDRKIAWKTVSGSSHAGVVTFEPVSDSTTKVTVAMEFDPEGFVEEVGDKIGVVGHRVADDLDRFKDFIEDQSTETGAWRGEVPSQRN